jgi:hypothetical protein
MPNRGNFGGGGGSGGAPSGPAGGDLTGTYPNPTLSNTTNVASIIETISLDKMAAPVANVSMNSHKITNLTNGSSSSDAAAFGQIPTSLPPNGTAAGDLVGTYPNPSVAKINGVPIGGVAAIGQGLQIDGSGTTAFWHTYTASDVGALGATAAAGGDLAGNYPNPTLSATSNVETIIRANRLDQLAAPTAAVSLNSQKITSLANGSSSADAAAFGQIPVAATSGAQGLVQLTGDFGGTAASPQVVSTHLSSALPIAQGGTSATSASAALAALSGTPISATRVITASTVTANAWDIIEANATSNTITVTPPTNIAGVKLIIKKTDSSTNAVIFNGTVDGTVNPSLIYQYGSMEVVGDGTNWYRTVRPSLGALVDYPAASDARYQRVTTVATATGTSADATNIATAIAAAGTGGTLYFPQGTYVCDSLAPLSGQTWYGPATIQRPASSTNSVITATGISNFTMRELTVDGNRSGASGATSNGVIYLINTISTLLQNITVQNSAAANAAIILRGAVRCIVDGCIFTTVGYGVLVGLNHGDAYSCYGNIIRGCTIDTTDNDAIFLSENLGSTTSITVTGSVIGTVVAGCTVRNFGDCGIEVGSGTLYTEVSGCSFIGISNGVGNNGILFRDSQNSNVTGCTVSNLTKTGSTGVYMVNLNSTNKHISINNVDCYNVGYGFIAVGGTSGSSIGTAAVDIGINGGIIDTTAIDAIHLNNVVGFNITGTQIHNAGQQGISIGKFSTSSASDGTITGCRIFNSSQQTTGDSGIIIFQSSADIVITGCRIGDNQGGSKTQAYGIRIFDTTVTNVTISNCDLTNGGTTSNFTNATAMGNSIQILNCIGVSAQGLTTAITQNAASWEPSDHNLIGWSFDTALTAASSTIPTSGCLYLVGLYARQSFTTTKGYISISVAGVTPTTGDNWIGLYNTAGVLCASKEIDSTVTASVGLQTITWTTPFTGPAGMYWVALLFNSATNPTIYRMSTPADNLTNNVGLTAPYYRVCQQGTGLLTLPSPLTVSSNSISNSPSTPRNFWVAIG